MQASEACKLACAEGLPGLLVRHVKCGIQYPQFLVSAQLQADRMLDMGFEPQIRKILAKVRRSCSAARGLDETTE